MKRLIFVSTIFSQIFSAFGALAANYTLLEKLPGVGGTSATESPDISTYFQWVFAFGISLAGILAVLMIVIGGVQYVTAYGNPGQIGKAKDRIWQALLGLGLAIGAWLILYTINPDLAKGTLNIPDINSSQSIIQMNFYG